MSNTDEWYLEAWGDDANRVRVVMRNNGEAGPWFSRLIHSDVRGILNVPHWAIPSGECN